MSGDTNDPGRWDSTAPVRKSKTPRRVQVGWMNPTTGVMCDCPVYERSPHAQSVPVYREEVARG